MAFFLDLAGLAKTSYRKKNAPAEEPMFQCIGMLASAVRPNLTKLLHAQLDLMFACGLSEPLRQALVAIARHIPPLLRTIQDRLLDLISITLSGKKLQAARRTANVPIFQNDRYQRHYSAADGCLSSTRADTHCVGYPWLV